MTLSVLRGNGSTLAANGFRLTRSIPAFKDLVAWNNSWDMAEAVTYTPGTTEQSNYGVGSSLRIASVPDRGSTPLPLLRDPSNHYSTAYSLPSQVPGPLYLASSALFAGRAVAQFDVLPSHSTFAAFLTATTDNTSATTWFNPTSGYSTPYWVALLGDYCDTFLGDDGDGPTMGSSFDGTRYGLACWHLGVNPSPVYINSRWSHDATSTRLLIGYNSGGGTSATDCFLEVTTRQTTGQLVTQRTYGGQDNNPYKTWFTGLVDGAGYTSAAGIQTGTPTENQLTAVRSWAANYMPAGGSGA